MISPSAHLESIPRVSRRIVPALKRLGIRTVRDLLFHFPARYEDFSNEKPIRDVVRGETVTLRGRIKKISLRRTAKKHMALVEAVLEDETGAIKALWFNQPFLMRNLHAGDSVQLSGKVTRGPGGVYLQNPAHEKILSFKHAPLRTEGSVAGFQTPNSKMIHTGGLVAVYPETKGISSRWIRFLVKSFIDLRKELRDPLPQEVLARHHLSNFSRALVAIHFPQSYGEAEAAQRRFRFEQLLLLQLRSLRERLQLKAQRAPAIPADVVLIKKFVQSLSFLLTDAQRRAVWEIAQDLVKPRPMNRLLEGDVGSGKTVVAAAATLLTIRAGYTAVFMAPTEILARQHFATLTQLLLPFQISIGLLTGAEKKIAHAPQVVVGTHALLQKGAQFENLGLVVIDEQHRFGVEQRAALTTSYKLQVTSLQKVLPHFLSMTATPIPRTLALAVYGDLDLSILDEMPKSRKPVITRIVEPGKRDAAYRFIREEVKKGRQVFVVCPRIEVPLPAGSGTSIRTGQQNLLLAEVKSVKEEYKKLSEQIFSDLKIAMLHGKMKSKEKEAVMQKFRNGETDILVSTSVIEVGVDVPNATIMTIEGAERFGLSQLHQFRGRVGRGGEQSYCLLFPTEDGMVTRRLKAVVEAKNGFELAEKDLAIRGPGDLFGTQQWGMTDTMLDALRDPILIRDARTEAVALLKKDPSLATYPFLLARLQELEQRVHLE